MTSVEGKERNRWALEKSRSITTGFADARENGKVRFYVAQVFVAAVREWVWAQRTAQGDSQFYNLNTWVMLFLKVRMLGKEQAFHQ